MLGKRSWRDWRNQWVMSPRFQRWAAAFPLTRSIARIEARDMFDVVAGFVYSQVVLACLRLGLLERLRAGAVGEVELQSEIDLPPAALRTLLRAAAAYGQYRARAVEPRGAASIARGSTRSA